MNHTLKAILATTIILITQTSFAEQPTQTQQNKYFDAIKSYAQRDFVLNDTLEFTMFDMSQIKFVDQSKGAVKNAKSTLQILPKYFYTSLKEQILKQRVPITLYSGESPSYAKPLLLNIKIDKIQFSPTSKNADGSKNLPVSIRIYGELIDKTSNETLLKYYDAKEVTAKTKNNQTKLAFKDISDSLMKDLAKYLRTKY